MQWIRGASNQNNPREVRLVSPCSLHFHSKRFQQGSQEVALPLCFSAWALKRKRHLKLFSDLLLSPQLYPCHWATQSYWTSQWPAETIQVPPCPCVFVTLPPHALVLRPDTFSLILTKYLGLSEQLSIVLLLFRICKSPALLPPPSPQLLPARPDSQLTASHAVPRTSSFAMVNHMHWGNLIEAVFFLSLCPHHGKLPTTQIMVRVNRDAVFGGIGFMLQDLEVVLLGLCFIFDACTYRFIFIAFVSELPNRRLE